MLLLWANSFAKACSLQANPFETIIILKAALGPLFDNLNQDMRMSTERRTTKTGKDEVLPLSSTD